MGWSTHRFQRGRNLSRSGGVRRLRRPWTFFDARCSEEVLPADLRESCPAPLVAHRGVHENMSGAEKKLGAFARTSVDFANPSPSTQYIMREWRNDWPLPGQVRNWPA